MANMNFDFNKIKRSFFTVTLKDGRVLPVKMPVKKTFEKMTALQAIDTENITADDAMDTLGGLVAEIVSHNMKQERVTTEYITENYDTEEMQLFLDGYMEFTKGIKDNPN